MTKIVGSYLVSDDASEVEQEARVPSAATKMSTNKKREKVILSAPKSKDIRTFFNQQRTVEKQKGNDDKPKWMNETTILID